MSGDAGQVPSSYVLVPVAVLVTWIAAALAAMVIAGVEGLAWPTAIFGLSAAASIAAAVRAVRRGSSRRSSPPPPPRVPYRIATFDFDQQRFFIGNGETYVPLGNVTVVKRRRRRMTNGSREYAAVWPEGSLVLVPETIWGTDFRVIGEELKARGIRVERRYYFID